MVEIGGKPIVWHIMKIFEKHGINDFHLALGYKADIIKDYFLKYNSSKFNKNIEENWTINLKDNGLNTMTGGSY